MTIEFVISNDELAQAIKEAYEVLNADTLNESTTALLVDNLKHLLSVQKFRADLMSIEQD